MRPEVLSVVACPECAVFPLIVTKDQLRCPDCEWEAPIEKDIPIFSAPPAGIVPSEKIERGPDSGTPWRQANWRFLHRQLAALPGEAMILDAGAGRGDFAAALAGRKSIALDIYPYPEIDLVADLTEQNPFQPASFDAILLLNVLEHIYDTHKMIEVLKHALKPGGLLIVAIPFLVKLHQTPVDYVRYTQFALDRIAEQHDLEVVELEGYYDPIFLLGEGSGAVRWSIGRRLPRVQRIPARILLSAIQFLAGLLSRLLGPGKSLPAGTSSSPAPTGYQIVYRKNA